MKNPLSDLNDKLFEQLNRLSNPDLKDDKLKEEIERSKAVSTISKDITANARMALDAYRIQSEVIGTRASMPDFLGISHEKKTP